MAETHPSFPQPIDTAVSVWRYTDLSKFIWMLQRGALYFARADLLGDPYEGYYTRAMADPAIYIADVKASFLSEGKGFGEKEDAMFKESFQQLIKFMRVFRKMIYVNCWHMNKHESQAMWKLYTSMSDSICIRSTYEKLWHCLPEKKVYLGNVTYVDYEIEGFGPYNMLNPIMHKRSSFKHEQEVRAVICEIPPDGNFEKETEPGKIGSVDIAALVEDVYVAPDCRPLLVEVVQGLVEKAGLTIEVKQSGVNAPPGY